MEICNLEIGKRLIQIRRARGLTQQQAAAILRMSNRSLSQYELGQRTLPYATLSHLIELYGVSYDIVLNCSRPLPVWLYGDNVRSSDTLEWRIAGMLITFRKSQRFYLLYCYGEGYYWIRHDTVRPDTVLASTLRLEQPESHPSRFPVEEFTLLSPIQIAAFLRRL